MNNDANERVKESNRLNQVLAEYVRLRDAGEEVDIESFCISHPDLADELRSYANGEGLLEALGSPHDAFQVESDVSVGETVRPGAARRTDLSPNAKFGRYRIIRLLGEGAMGSISLAEDTNLGRQVALKIPKFTGLEDHEFRQRFTREARAAAKLDHPNICRVYDAGEINGTPFITMEYIDGQPLSRFVGVEDFKDQRRVAEVVCAIASGLAHAHEQGILHRDLKPGNVLMKGDSTPCITDFGLARTVEANQESRLTHEGTILGTPAYMSPEQIEGKTDGIGQAADIYALGVVLYELLTGRIPFQGSIMSILGQVLRDRPTPLSKLRQGVDPQLADLCLEMLEKTPDKRPSSMQAVADRLGHWLMADAASVGHDAANQDELKRAKAQQTLDRLEGMKAKILDLIQRGQFAAAVAGLEKMIGLKPPEAAEYVAWARQKLPEVKKLPQQLQQGVPALLATARRCLKEHDYAQAAQLLQGIPQDFRNEEVRQVLEKAIDLQEEADLLLADLQECVQSKQYEGIESNLKRFLKLKPGNKFARELWASLQTYSKVPPKQRKFRYDERGRLLPQGGGSLWDNWLLWGTVCFVLAFGGMTWGITIYLKSGDRTLAVEIDDDWLKEQGGQLTLAVDGQEHRLTASDLDITVSLGEHGFTVKNGETVIHNPQTFTIAKSGRQVLNIDGTGMRLAAAGSPSSAKPAVPQPDRQSQSSAWTPTAEQQAFFDEVGTLSAAAQVEAVRKKLIEVNPDFNGELTHKIKNGRVVELSFFVKEVQTIWPVRALTHLANLECKGRHGWSDRALFSDLSPLAGMRLTKLDFNGTQVSDLSPLKDMPLTSLRCGQTLVSDLSPLEGMPLELLYCTGNPKVADLTPLKEMPLRFLLITGTAVTDLTPLAGMKLNSFYGGERISDVSLLAGMPLTDVVIHGSLVSDLSPLAGSSLRYLNISFSDVRDLAPLDGIQSVQDLRMWCLDGDFSYPILNQFPVEKLHYNFRLFHQPDEDWLRSLSIQQIGAKQFSDPNNPEYQPIDEFWQDVERRRRETATFIADVKELDVAGQLRKVRERLVQLNPRFDGSFGANSEDGEITSLTLSVSNITDITPLRALSGLKRLTVSGDNTKGRFHDLSPLNTLPLDELTCDEPLIRWNRDVLRAIPTLKTLNDEPASTFLNPSPE